MKRSRLLMCCLVLAAALPAGGVFAGCRPASISSSPAPVPAVAAPPPNRGDAPRTPPEFGQYADLMKEPGSPAEAAKQEAVLEIVYLDAQRQLCLANAWAARAEVKALRGEPALPRPTDGDTTPDIPALLKQPLERLKQAKKAAEAAKRAAEQEQTRAEKELATARAAAAPSAPAP